MATQAERAALQQAGQYAGLPNVLTPENAPDVGLDPERGFVAKGTPTDAIQPPEAPPAPPFLAEGIPGGQPQNGQNAPFASNTPPDPRQGSVLSNLLNSTILGGQRIPGQMAKLQPSQNGQQKESGEIKIPGSTEIKDDSTSSEIKIPGSTEIKDDTGNFKIPGSTEVKPGPEQVTTPPAPQPQTPSLPTPMPSGTGAAAPQGQPAQPQLTVPTPTASGPTAPEAEQEASTQGQISTLISQGHSPGTAQAIVNGQQPKTLTGNAPQPKPQVQPPAPPTPSESDEAIRAANEKTLANPPPAEAKPPTPVNTLKAGDGNRVDPVGLYSYLLGKFSNSGLVGYVPPDGARWGIKTGSAAEWAAFGLAVAKQESDLNARSYNDQDPGGSAGLFQFGQGQTQFTKGGDQFDPQQSADAFVRSVQHYLANKGSVANLGETFGSIRRPNEAGQYIAGAQKVAAGGNGKDLVSSGGGDKTSSKQPAEKEAPSPQISLPGGSSSSASLPGPSGGGYHGGGGSYTSGGQQQDSSNAGKVSFYPGGWSGGGGSGGQSSGGGDSGPQQLPPQRMSVSAPLPDQDQQNSVVTALMQRGFNQQQAVQLAQGMQTVAPGKGIGPLQTLGAPPAAPGAPQLPASPTLSLTSSQKPPVTPKLLPAKQLMPSVQVPKLGPPTVDPSVVLGLMKRGFTREQAIAFAGKATVSAPGATTTPRPTPAVPPAPSKAPAQVTPQQQAPARQPQQAAAPAAPSKPPSDLPPPKPKPQRSQEPTEFTGAPAGSTRGDPTPPGSDTILQSPKLKDQALAHAAILSPDDPRVKKQADGYIKGEHFVEGDPFHDSMLNGLPYGKQGRQRQILGQAEQAIADSSPMHISYISSPKEAEKFPTRESRKVQYEEHSPEARLMGTTEGQLVGHSLIPLAAGIKLSNKGSEPHQSYIQGISTNVLANNFEHLNSKLEGMGRKTPYEKLGPKFYNDLEGYYSNLNAGHTATGRGYAVGTKDHPNEPDRDHVPYQLSRKEADFIGMVINNTAAFAKHDDAKKIRELARANGTLIDEKGETNRLRHDIEQHEPGWRERVMEPSIRSFKVGLVHEIHPSEEHMPQSIRPGKEFQNLTKAIARTSERGRPDIPIAASLHHNLDGNKVINAIERDFSEDKITEEQARKRLKDIGEDPGDYRFVSGSGGLVTPYESDPESLSPEEHDQMKDALKKKWVSGGMNIEDYRKRAAEVPLPTKPSRPAAPSESPSSPLSAVPRQTMPDQDIAKPRRVPAMPSQESPSTASSPETLAPVEAPEAPPVPKPKPQPLAPRPPKPPKPKAPPEPEDTGLAASTPSIGQVKPPASDEPEPEAPASKPQVPVKPPAPDEPLPASKPRKTAPTVKQTATPAVVEVPPPTGVLEKPSWKTANEKTRQGYLKQRVAQDLEKQYKGEDAHPLEVDRNDDKSIKYDPAGNPIYKKIDYDLANSPLLKKKGLGQIQDADKHEDTLGNLIDPDGKEVIDPETGEPMLKHGHLNQTERRRLSAMHTASAVHTMGNKIVDEFMKIKDVPEIAAGEGWYSRMREKLAGALGEHHELFAQLLGATSAKTPVRNNFVQSLDALEQYKSGKFDNHIKKYLEAFDKMQEGKGALVQHMKNQGIPLYDKDGNTVETHDSDAAAMANWVHHHGILPRQMIQPGQAEGSKYNANSMSVLRALAGTWLKEVDAPKTPNFAGNLTGRTLEATIDVWAARFLKRLGYEGQAKGPWRSQGKSEPGVNALDFAFSQDAMRHAADEITKRTGKKMNPDDLQAIAWFAEKHHWEKKGWTRGAGAEKSSFDDVADLAFPKTGEAMTSSDLRKHYGAIQAEQKRVKARVKTAKTYVGNPNPKMAAKLEPYMAQHGLTHEQVHGPEVEEEDEDEAA